MRFRALSLPMAANDGLRERGLAIRQWIAGKSARAVVLAGRLATHRAQVAAAALLCLVLIPVADLSWRAALATFVVLMAIIASGDQEGPGEDQDQDQPQAATTQGTLPTPPDREPAEPWQAVIDAMRDPAVAIDRAGNILHANRLLLELFPLARPGHPVTHMSRNPELIQAIDAAYTSAGPVVVRIFERVPLERCIEATVSRLMTARDRRDLPRLLVSFRDLTEQDRLAEMRADFIANASHELRTPLASLRGFVETLQGPARDDPAARDRFLAIMASQAMRMTRLIDDLLSLSRVEMRAHLPPRGIVDLNDAAAYVVQALAPLAETSGTTLVVNKCATPARIRGDRDEIVQVLQNLMHNALKYGRDGGRVEVAISQVLDGTPPAPRLLVAVADDGPGIAPEHLPRLTERFYRVNVAASQDKGGTGLGLAIVKHIVIRHRGELRIASEIGKGSTFSVLFEPLAS